MRPISIGGRDMRLLTTTAALAVLLGTSAFAGECPAGSPEGYQWLSGYVDEFNDKGTISDWFTGSFAENPEDYALKALNAYFEADGNVDAARDLFVSAGGIAAEFDAAMKCAGVSA